MIPNQQLSYYIVKLYLQRIHVSMHVYGILHI